jgi:hypothetical protein
MKHAFEDNKPPVLFHFQLVQDFVTVEEIAQKLLEELGRFRVKTKILRALKNDPHPKRTSGPPRVGAAKLVGARSVE